MDEGEKLAAFLAMHPDVARVVAEYRERCEALNLKLDAVLNEILPFFDAVKSSEDAARLLGLRIEPSFEMCGLSREQIVAMFCDMRMASGLSYRVAL